MRKLILSALLLSSCQPAADGNAGADGVPGPQGPPGPMGAMGAPGKDGAAGGATGSDNRSGTRIKVTMSMGIVYKTMDGAVMEQDVPRKYGLHDSKLDTACEVAAGADGQLRCLPIAPLAVYFSDDRCTRPFYVQDKPGPPVCGSSPPPAPAPKYFRLRPWPDPCRPWANGDTVYMTGAVQLLPDPLFMRPVGTSECKFVQLADREKLSLTAYPGTIVTSGELALVGGELAKTVVLP